LLLRLIDGFEVDNIVSERIRNGIGKFKSICVRDVGCSKTLEISCEIETLKLG
jgi:hypothetical protein